MYSLAIREEVPRVRGETDGEEEIENVPAKECSEASGPHPIDLMRRQIATQLPFFRSSFFYFPNRRSLE